MNSMDEIHPKRQVIIFPDGQEEVRGVPADRLPSLREMSAIVCGPIELVRVLRPDLLPRLVFTYMVVHEEGLLQGLPRNQKATDLYLENMRRQFPGLSPKEAKDRSSAAYVASMSAKMGKPVTVHHAPEPVPGYDDDPYIAGTVLYFDRWTCEELQRAGL